MGELYWLCQPFSGNYTFNHLHCMIVRHAFHPISHMWLMKFSSFIFAQQLPIFNSLLHSALVFKLPEKTFPLFNANFWSRSCIFLTFLKSYLPCSYPLLPPNMSWKQTAAVVLKKPSSTFNTAEAWPSLTLWWSHWPSIPQLPHDGLLNTAASATFTRTGRGPRSGSLSVRQIQPCQQQLSVFVVSSYLVSAAIFICKTCVRSLVDNMAAACLAPQMIYMSHRKAICYLTLKYQKRLNQFLQILLSPSTTSACLFRVQFQRMIKLFKIQVVKSHFWILFQILLKRNPSVVLKCLMTIFPPCSWGLSEFVFCHVHWNISTRCWRQIKTDFQMRSSEWWSMLTVVPVCYSPLLLWDFLFNKKSSCS